MNKIPRAPAVVVLLLCLSSFAAAEDLDMEIAARGRARHELEGKIQQYNETAEKKSQQARRLQARLSDLQQNSQMAQQQIKLLQLQSDNLQRSISALDVEMSEISRQVDTLLDELRLRVLNIYKYGSREELNLLLSAESANEAVASVYLLERFTRQDRLAIDELLVKAAVLERSKRSIERNKAQLITRTEALNNQREKYDAVINQTSAALSGVQRERQMAETAAKETERAQLEIERVMADLMRKKRELPQDAPAAGTGSTVSLNLGRDLLLDWPVEGTIASHYGPRVHPDTQTKSFNSGINISATAGTPVKAAGPGTVLYEGWLDGFGQVVIIDHGRNISTVYAHLGSTRVKEKDAVQLGSVIGTVGNTGALGGYNLHFEVRVGDSAKNPLDYLRKT